MNTYIISEDIVIGIINYLKTKPYGEVAEGIYALQHLPIHGGQKSREPVADTDAEE